MLFVDKYVSSVFELVRARTDYDNSTWDNCPKQKVVVIVCSNVGTIVLSSQCNKRQARAQNFFAPISINLVPKVV